MGFLAGQCSKGANLATSDGSVAKWTQKWVDEVFTRENVVTFLMEMDPNETISMGYCKK